MIHTLISQQPKKGRQFSRFQFASKVDSLLVSDILALSLSLSRATGYPLKAALQYSEAEVEPNIGVKSRCAIRV